MRATKQHVLTLACVVALLALPVAAQEDGAFTGSFQIGFRSVDVDGSPSKYSEDINLEDGPRLFRFDIDYIPADEMRKFADKVSIDINNFGGDPFETLSVSVEKFGRYDFDYDRRKSNYFYNDVILPIELAGDPALALAGDFHHFDFDRVHDRANFKVWFGDNATFNFGLNRYTRKGESTTTLDIGRDEFEFDKPIDESLNDYLGSLQYSWDKVTLVLEERYRQFDNVVELFLPGRSLGEDPVDATILDFYFSNQPYDYTSNDHIVRLVAQPNDKLVVRLQADIQSVDLDLTADETGAGINFDGAPLVIDNVGSGEVNRDMDLFDLDLTYRLNERWGLILGARQNSLDQQGNRVFADTPGSGDWQIDTTSVDFGAQVHLSSKVTVAAGVREESRDLDSRWALGDDIVTEKVKTDQTGYFANLAWAPRKGCRVNVELEDSSFDDPFTLTAPTDRQRYKVRGQYKLTNGFSLLGSLAVQELDNKRSGWDSSSEQLALRVMYDKDKLSASVGYSNVDVDRKIDQTAITAPGFGGGVELFFPINYGIDSDFVDARFRYAANDRVAFGGDLRMYDNSGTFGVERDDYRGWVEVGVGDGYLVHLGYRTIDFNETRFNFDDYSADIAEVSIGYRW
jgi:hypothetical protein